MAAKKDEHSIIKRLSVVGIGGNILLTGFKGFAGVAGHSGALVSDAIHSLSDVLATLIAVVGVKMSRVKADEDHPYGHERLESVATLFLSLILAAAGFFIGKAGVLSIFYREFEKSTPPGKITIVAAAVSIFTKEAMFWYTMHYARLLNSPAFKADAWHHRSDAASSVGSLLGVLGARLGFPVADPLASVVICIFILKVAFSMMREALGGLVDKSCDSSYDKSLYDFIAQKPGVVKVDLLRTRKFGNRIYVDLEISVDGNIPLRDAHAIAQAVHNGVESAFPDIKHIMIHVNPA